MIKEKKILVTGGTVFVSRYVAEYYVKKGYTVYVLNRNHGVQSDGVNLLQADRHALGDSLRPLHFDVVFDMTAYTAEDVNDLLDALGSYDDYILLSSGAVYPETAGLLPKRRRQERINSGANTAPIRSLRKTP